MIRYHLDENVDHSIAQGLRARGIDVTTTSDANLVGADDSEQLRFAAVGHRVVVTHDDDFLRLHNAGINHEGIVYSRQGSRSSGEIIRFLKLLSDCLEAAEMRGKVEYF